MIVREPTSAGNSKNPQNFQISRRCFLFQAEDLDFPLESLFSWRFFNSPAGVRNFRRNILRSAGNLDSLLEILFSSRFFKFPAGVLFFKRKI